LSEQKKLHQGYLNDTLVYNDAK